MIAREVRRLDASRHPQAGADRALARSEDGTHHQNEHMLPTGGREACPQVLQPMTQNPRNRIACRSGESGMMLHPMFRIPRR